MRRWGSKVGEKGSNRDSSCVIFKIESVNLHSFLLRYLVFGVWPCPLKIYSKEVKADRDIRNLPSNQSNKTSLTGTLYQVNLRYRAVKKTKPTNSAPITKLWEQMPNPSVVICQCTDHSNSRGLRKVAKARNVVSSHIKSMRRYYFSAWLDPLQATVCSRAMYYQFSFFYDRATWLPSKETKKKKTTPAYLYCTYFPDNT